MSLSQEEIVQEFMNCQQRLRAMAYAMCYDYHVVDDIMQEVVITLIKKRESYDDSRAFAPWAAGVTRLKILEYLRKNKRAPLPVDDDLLMHLQDSMLRVMENMDLKERANAMMSCIGKLPADGRQVLLMKYNGRLSVKQISAKIKRTVTGTQSLLQRLRLKILDCVQDRLRRAI